MPQQPTSPPPRVRPPREKTSIPGVYKVGQRYSVHFRDSSGASRSRSAATLKEARALKASLTTAVDSGTFRQPSKVTLREFALEWVSGYTGRTRTGQVRDETRAGYKLDLERYVLPVLGRKRLTEITPQDVRKLATSMASGTHPKATKPLSPSTVRRAIAPLRACLADAREDGLIPTNPAAGVRLPGGSSKPPEERARALSPDELSALMAHIPDQHRLIIRFLASTGLRISEALALRWENVDLDAPSIKVVERVRDGVLAPPKSSYGRRDVPLSPDLARAMRAHRLASRHSLDSDRVFSGQGGGFVNAGYLFRVVRAAAGKAGLVNGGGKPWVGLHTMRHTCASMLFRYGWSAKQVQIVLGHHSPAFTLATYVHLMPDDLPAPPAVLDEILGS